MWLIVLFYASLVDFLFYKVIELCESGTLFREFECDTMSLITSQDERAKIAAEMHSMQDSLSGGL